MRAGQRLATAAGMNRRYLDHDLHRHQQQQRHHLHAAQQHRHHRQPNADGSEYEDDDVMPMETSTPPPSSILQHQPSTEQTDSEQTVTSHLSIPHFALHRQVRYYRQPACTNNKRSTKPLVGLLGNQLSKTLRISRFLVDRQIPSFKLN